jgi:hypothetical protein
VTEHRPPPPSNHSALTARLRRGSHRLGVFLAGVTMLLGIGMAAIVLRDGVAGSLLMLGFTLGGSLAIYGLVRAIGWVVAGFTSS